jgi:hypothetical protein
MYNYIVAGFIEIKIYERSFVDKNLLKEAYRNKSLLKRRICRKKIATN